MIQNILERHELIRFLRPFLRLASAEEVVAELSSVLGIAIQSREDIVCQTKVHLSYQGYRIDIRDLRWIEGSGFAPTIQFKAKKKWYHGVFKDQIQPIIEDLKSICCSEIDGLTFKSFSASPPTNPFFREEPVVFTFLHDARAFNPEWSEGRDISPLLIAPDSHHGNCFVEFQFNPGGYYRNGSKTLLRPDWLQSAFCISRGIESDARRRLGLE